MVLQPITVKLSEKEISFVKWMVDNDLAINRSEAIRKLIQTEMKNADKDRGSQWVAPKPIQQVKPVNPMEGRSKTNYILMPNYLKPIDELMTEILTNNDNYGRDTIVNKSKPVHLTNMSPITHHSVKKQH